MTSGLGGRAAVQLTLVVACFSISLLRKGALDIYNRDQSNRHREGKSTSSTKPQLPEENFRFPH